MGVNSLPKTCYPTASRLRFEPRPFCAWVQHANHSATEPPPLVVVVRIILILDSHCPPDPTKLSRRRLTVWSGQLHWTCSDYEFSVGDNREWVVKNQWRIPGGGRRSPPRKKAIKYFWTWVKINPATKNFLSNSVRVVRVLCQIASFEDILTPK